MQEREKERQSFNILKILQLKYLQNMVYLLQFWKWSRLITLRKVSRDGRTEKQWNKVWGGRPCVLSCLFCGSNCFSQLHFSTNLFFQDCFHNMKYLWIIRSYNYILSNNIRPIESHRLRKKSIILNLHNTHFGPTISHLLLSKLQSCDKKCS